MTVDDVLRFWPVILVAAAVAVALLKLSWSQARDNADRKRETDDLAQDVNRLGDSLRSELRTEIAGVRHDLHQTQRQLDDHQRSQTEFQLSVSNRLTAIETMLGGMVGRIEATIREALKG